MMKKNIRLLAAVAAALAVGGVQAQTLRIGALPAADSIVLYVAQDAGLFAKQGLDVKVIPFKSALEIGAAMRADRLDGHFGDLMNVFMQNARGVKQSIILTTTHTNPEQRNFGFVVSPAYAKTLTDLKGLKGEKTAMASATIIDYLLTRMSEEEKLPAGAYVDTEVKQIPIRLQMLMSGKVPTALLPEPLISVVEARGGRVIWDDRGLNEALAVVALKDSVLDEKTVAGFKKAVSESARLIEADPEHYRAVMVQKHLLPKPVAQDYKMVRFSMFKTADGLPPLPSTADVTRVGQWLVDKGILKSVPAYSDVVRAQ